MARINIEDSIWSDPRFMRLCIKLRDERTAVGTIVLAWKTAQAHWCPDKQPIPHKNWIEAQIGREIIEVGLAKEMPEGIYICGSEEHFAWWFEKQQAGKRSAEVRKKKFGSSQPKSSNRPRTVFEESSNGLEQVFEESRTSSSSSSSLLEDPLIKPNLLEDPLIQPEDPIVIVNITPELKNSVPGATVLKLPKRVKSEEESMPSVLTGEWVLEKITSWDEIRKIYNNEDEWIEKEVRKMAVWLTGNRQKMPKSKRGWTRFITTWLSRGWESYRRTLPTNKVEERVVINHDALWEKSQ